MRSTQEIEKMIDIFNQKQPSVEQPHKRRKPHEKKASKAAKMDDDICDLFTEWVNLMENFLAKLQKNLNDS